MAVEGVRGEGGAAVEGGGSVGHVVDYYVVIVGFAVISARIPSPDQGGSILLQSAAVLGGVMEPSGGAYFSGDQVFNLFAGVKEAVSEGRKDAKGWLF